MQADRAYHRGCAPVPMRHRIDHALATKRPAIQPGHIRFGPAFIDENQSSVVDRRDFVAPRLALLLDVRAALFAGVDRLFL